MSIPALETVAESFHCSNAAIFEGRENEYVRSLMYENYTIGYHTHSFYELNVVLGGEGYHYFDQKPSRVNQGCVFLIPPYTPHGYFSEQSLKVYHLVLRPEFLDRYLSEFRQTQGFHLLFETEPYLRAHSEENVHPVLTEKELASLLRDVEELDECEGMQDRDLYANAIAKKILCRLFMLSSKRLGVERDRLSGRRETMSIAYCLNYIHLNPDEKLTVEGLAKRLNLSRSTFIRQFNKVCGCSPYQYIREYRKKHANELLASGKSPSRVAQACGFYDASHMRKCLKEK